VNIVLNLSNVSFPENTFHGSQVMSADRQTAVLVSVVQDCDRAKRHVITEDKFECKKRPESNNAILAGS
jgi:hypothetical protein